MYVFALIYLINSAGLLFLILLLVNSLGLDHELLRIAPHQCLLFLIEVTQVTYELKLHLFLLPARYEQWKVRLLHKLESCDGLLLRPSILSRRKYVFVSTLNLFGCKFQKSFLPNILPLIGLKFDDKLAVLVLNIKHVVNLSKCPLVKLTLEDKSLLKKCFLGLTSL